MKLDQAIEQVEVAESRLADDLRKVGERHATEADVYHTAHLLASRCATQLERLAPHAARYGAQESTVAPEPGSLGERLRRLTSEALGRQVLTGAMLLEDLRDLYLSAHDAELAWVILSQAAKAAHDAELVSVAQVGQQEAERRWKWLRTKIKEASPQVLVAG
jgi:hypothetical protein